MKRHRTKSYKNFLQLVNDLESKVNLDDYSDENWCENYTLDEYFLYVLCWAGWTSNRQEEVWEKVRNSFHELRKQLHELKSSELERLCESYPLPWQKKWLRRLVDFLQQNSLTTKYLVNELRGMSYEDAYKKLQAIVDTESEKIVNCWLRDVVRIDAFPIDSRVRRVLQKYKLPVDSDFMVECCKKYNVPVKSFNRALYENVENIVREN